MEYCVLGLVGNLGSPAAGAFIHESKNPTLHSETGPRGRPRTCNLSVLSGTSLLIGLHAVGAHGRICTDTVRVLSAPSLHWTTWAKWCRVRDFHPQPLRSDRSVSCSWTNAA